MELYASVPESQSENVLGIYCLENCQWLYFTLDKKTQPIQFFHTIDETIAQVRIFRSATSKDEKQESFAICRVIIDDTCIKDALNCVQYGDSLPKITGKCIEYFWFPGKGN